MRVVALAGGVGAARFLRGLVRAVAPRDITVVVNTGDDREFYGVHVCPDLDIVTYTLAGRIDPDKGYGLAGDSFAVIDTLEGYGREAWFRLGDRDLATALHRTLRLREGAGLAQVTDELRRAHGLELRILPMSEDPCPTYVQLGQKAGPGGNSAPSGGTQVHFEEYLARDGAPDDVTGVNLAAAEAASAAPGVVEAVDQAEVILVCPSNPVVSIGPILAVPEIRAVLERSRVPTVGVSPIVGGAPVKGPADRLLRGIGSEVSARGVARLYRELCDGFVIDERDADQATDVEALGLACRVTDTVMRDAATAESVARTALELAAELAARG